MPTLDLRGEIANELTKFLMKFKHLMKLERPTLPDPSTIKPRSTRALQTEKGNKESSHNLLSWFLYLR